MTSEKKAAGRQAMNDLHAELARVLKDAVTLNHLVVTKGKDGEQEEVVIPPPAAILNVARQFLKDNGIEADPDSNQPLRNLATSLPFGNPEEDKDGLRN